MQLNPAEISELLKSKIQNLQVTADTRNQGTIVSVTDGIVRIYGLSEVMQGEMIEFPGGIYGLALNLERDSVGAVVLGEYENITEGMTVKTTGRILEVPIGPELIGRVVNALGEPIDGKGPINAKMTDVIEKVAPGVIARRSVSQPVQTGLKSIDAMVPIGRGQRELIIGDRQTGKTLLQLTPSLTKRVRTLFAFMLQSDRRPRPLLTWSESSKSLARWITPLWSQLRLLSQLRCNIWLLTQAARWASISATADKTP